MRFKGWVSAAVSLALMTGVATSAFAATPGKTAGNRPQPTAQQAAELKQIHDQMKGVREQIIDKFVAFGWLTAEKAAQMKTNEGAGNGRPVRQGRRPGHGSAGDFACIREKLSGATAQQKSELAALRDQLAGLHQQEAAKMASYGWTVPERGTHMNARPQNPDFDGTASQN